MKEPPAGRLHRSGSMGRMAFCECKARLPSRIFPICSPAAGTVAAFNWRNVGRPRWQLWRRNTSQQTLPVLWRAA